MKNKIRGECKLSICLLLVTVHIIKKIHPFSSVCTYSQLWRLELEYFTYFFRSCIAAPMFPLSAWLAAYMNGDSNALMFFRHACMFKMLVF